MGAKQATPSADLRTMVEQMNVNVKAVLIALALPVAASAQAGNGSIASEPMANIIDHFASISGGLAACGDPSNRDEITELSDMAAEYLAPGFWPWLTGAQGAVSEAIDKRAQRSFDKTLLADCDIPLALRENYRSIQDSLRRSVTTR